MADEFDSRPHSTPRAAVVICDDSGLLPLDESRLRGVLVRILDDHGVRRTLSLALVDDARIREIHREFLGVDSPTDVISFPLEKDGTGVDNSFPLEEDRTGVDADPEDPFGEVVVSVETALREAPGHGHEARREAALYAIHGTLHLVGFDDLDEASRAEMRRAETEYLTVYDTEPD